MKYVFAILCNLHLVAGIGYRLEEQIDRAGLNIALAAVWGVVLLIYLRVMEDSK